MGTIWSVQRAPTLRLSCVALPLSQRSFRERQRPTVFSPTGNRLIENRDTAPTWGEPTFSNKSAVNGIYWILIFSEQQFRKARNTKKFQVLSLMYQGGSSASGGVCFGACILFLCSPVSNITITMKAPPCCQSQFKARWLRSLHLIHVRIVVLRCVS